MDNQNPGMPSDPNQGGGMSTPDQGAPASPEQPVAQAEEKCSTCGSPASGGNCVPCGQGQMSCTCPPPASSTGSEGGSAAPTV